MLKIIPSKIALTLDMKSKVIDSIVYFNSYIVLSLGNQKNTFLKKHLIIPTCISNTKHDLELRNALVNTLLEIKLSLPAKSFFLNVADELVDHLKDIDNDRPISVDECVQFINRHSSIKIEIGARAILEMLKVINLNEEFEKLSQQVIQVKSSQEHKKIVKRLKIINDFRKAKIDPA